MTDLASHATDTSEPQQMDELSGWTFGLSRRQSSYFEASEKFLSSLSASNANTRATDYDVKQRQFLEIVAQYIEFSRALASLQTHLTMFPILTVAVEIHERA